jgi:hypothetical protein
MKTWHALALAAFFVGVITAMVWLMVVTTP